MAQGYSAIVAMTRDERKHLHACDYHYLMKENPECNFNWHLASPDQAVRDAWNDWKNKNPLSLPPIADPENSKYHFSYLTPGFICGFNINELAEKFHGQMCWNTFEDKVSEDATTLFIAMLDGAEPNWEKEAQEGNPDYKPRGFCEWQPAPNENKLVVSKINCNPQQQTDVEGGNTFCCVLHYSHRFRLNHQKRHEVFHNLIKNKRLYRHSRIFTQDRLKTISEVILQQVKQHCSDDTINCAWPSTWNFGSNWEEDKYNSGTGTWNNSLSNAASIDKVLVNSDTVTAGHEIIAGGMCQCHGSGSSFPVGAKYLSNNQNCGSEVKHYCIGGDFICRDNVSNFNNPSTNEVRCGEPGSAVEEIQVGIMKEFTDYNPNHYYNWDIRARFQQVPRKMDGETINQVVGSFALDFKYNPLSTCNNNNEISGDLHCTPWTRTIESRWNFIVYNRYPKEGIHGAVSWMDLRLKLIPLHCDLKYRPVKIGPHMLKCEMQKKLMTNITTQIWHEKLKYDLEEIFKGNLVHKGWVADPEQPITQDQDGNLSDWVRLQRDGGDIEYVAGMCFVAEPSWDPTVGSSEKYVRDANGVPVISEYGTVYEGQEMTKNNCWDVHVIKDTNNKNYFGNLDNLNKDVSNFMFDHLNNKQNHYIPHCLKKHLTFNKMDFYCLTDTGETVDYEQFDADNIQKIVGDMAKHFADMGPYETVQTSNGKWVIQNSNTLMGNDGHVYTEDAANQFTNPDERRNAMTQDFEDKGQIGRAHV